MVCSSTEHNHTKDRLDEIIVTETRTKKIETIRMSNNLHNIPLPPSDDYNQREMFSIKYS